MNTYEAHVSTALSIFALCASMKKRLNGTYSPIYESMVRHSLQQLFCIVDWHETCKTYKLVIVSCHFSFFFVKHFLIKVDFLNYFCLNI